MDALVVVFAWDAVADAVSAVVAAHNAVAVAAVVVRNDAAVAVVEIAAVYNADTHGVYNYCDRRIDLCAFPIHGNAHHDNVTNGYLV